VKTSQTIITLASFLLCTSAKALVNSNNCANFSQNKCYYTSQKAVKYAQDYHGKLDSAIFTYYSDF